MGGWHIAAAVCSSASLILLLTALVSPHWLEPIDGNVGLWEICGDTPTGTVCVDLGMNVKGYIHATRAFLIMGVFPGSISCVSIFLLFFRSEIGSFPIQVIAMFSSYIAGILVMIAMAIFTGYWGTEFLDYTTYGWSEILGWLSVVLFPVTARLSIRITIYTPI